MRIACLVFAGLASVASADAYAQDIPAVALGGVIGSKLIDKFEDAGNRLLQNAGQQGDIMGSKFGNEIRVATANLNLALGDQRQLIYEDLQPPLRESFDAINGMLIAATQIGNKAVSIEEAANINLIEFTNRLPFAAKVDFYISSIQGLTQPYRASDYKIYLNGLGLGLSDSETKYDLTLLVDDKPIPSAAYQRTSSHETFVTVPHDFLDGMFADDKTTTHPVKILLNVEKNSRKLLFFRSTTKNSYEIDLQMILLPRFPGEISGSQPIQQTVQGDILQKSTANTVNGCSSHHPCDWSQTVALAQDEFAVGVTFQCAGQCAFDYALRHGGQGIDFDITDGGHSVTVYRHDDGDAGPTTVTHYVQYRKVAKAFTQIPIKSMKINFGEPIQIDLDPSNVQCAYALTAKLVTKQQPYIDDGMSASADHLLQRTSTSKQGDHCRVTIGLNSP